jgi:hypothetical protein
MEYSKRRMEKHAKMVQGCDERIKEALGRLMDACPEGGESGSEDMEESGGEREREKGGEDVEERERD